MEFLNLIDGVSQSFSGWLSLSLLFSSAVFVLVFWERAVLDFDALFEILGAD